MNTDVYLIRIDGTDFESPEEINVSTTFYSDAFSGKDWAITKLATYIKPMVLVGRTLRNLTATTYVVREEETNFGTGMIVLTDKMSTANYLAKNTRSDGHHGTTEWDFNKVGTEIMCVAIRNGEQILRKVMAPDHQIGSKFDVKKHCRADKFQQVCYGYNVYTQKKKRDAQHKEWDAWLGDDVADSAQATQARYEAQKSDTFAYMPKDRSRHFSRYRYAVLIEKAQAANLGREKTIINKDTVLRLFPDNNVFLTGQFLLDTKGALWAEVEVAQGSWQDTLGFVVQGIKHNAWTLNDLALHEECARLGIQLRTLQLRDGVEAEDVPTYKEKKLTGSDGHYTTKQVDTGISMWDALREGKVQLGFWPELSLSKVWELKDKGEEITAKTYYTINTNINGSIYYAQVLALAQNYRYYAIALIERRAIFEALYNQLKDVITDKITYYAYKSGGKKKKQKITLRELIDNIQYWKERVDFDSSAEQCRHYWLWVIRSTVKKVIGEEDYENLIRYAFDFQKWCRYVWNSRLFEERDKTDNELRAELEREYRKLYYEDNPVCDITELNSKTTLWVRAGSNIGIEGESVYLDKKGNWAINCIRANEEDGMPEFVPQAAVYDDEGNIVSDGVADNITLTVTYADALKQAEKLEELQQRLDEAEKAAAQQKQKKNFLPLAAAAAAVLLN